MYEKKRNINDYQESANGSERKTKGKNNYEWTANLETIT